MRLYPQVRWLSSVLCSTASFDCPLWRFAFRQVRSGRTDSLTAVEKAGLQLFRGKGGCTACHIGPNFTDEQFHNTGVAWRDGRYVDEGRFAVSGSPQAHGAFKTPTLRDISRTAPYMHDGSLATLDDVVESTGKAAVRIRS